MTVCTARIYGCKKCTRMQCMYSTGLYIADGSKAVSFGVAAVAHIVSWMSVHL